MLLPINMIENFKDGFCWREYRVTVDTGPRLRLPSEIVKTLKKHNVKALWLYNDPTGPRLILCPDKFQDTYLKVAQDNFPQNMDLQEAYRKYICTAKTWAVKKHGKISVGSFRLGDEKIERGNLLTILGTGMWYELSK